MASDFERVEKYVLAQIIELGMIPKRDTILKQMNISSSLLNEFDAQYHVLDSLWSFSKRHLEIFFNKLAAEDEKPECFKSLVYLIAQTDIQFAREKLNKGH